MTVSNPEHLLDQAQKLAAPSGAPPRQVDLKRAISATYYAVFHAILTAVADQIVGVRRRNTPEYEMVFRSLSHKTLRDVCDGLAKGNSGKQSAVIPPGGFSAELIRVAEAVVILQEQRHSADYDPLYRATPTDVIAAIQLSRDALRRWAIVPAPQRRLFLLMLAFK
jgi:hypothetical protein